MEDKSIDILGVKPLSKAIEKVTDKTVDGIGAFFSAICMPAAEEFGLLLKDKVAAFRVKNLEKIAARSKEIIEHQEINIKGKSNPLLLREIIQEASWQDDETIQSMWAGLLAIAAGSISATDDSLVYTDILKRITPFQARLINRIYKDPRCSSIKPPISPHSDGIFYPENPLIYPFSDILSIYPGDLSEIVPLAYRTHDQILESASDHDIAISRFRPQIEALASLKLIHDIKFNSKEKNIMITPTFKGLDFYMRCLGYSVYPLEAFILTLQHWCQKKNIDPFTYKI